MKLLALAAVTAAVAVSASLVGMPTAAAATPKAANVLRAGTGLTTGEYLRSADGAYTATVTRAGRLVVRHHGKQVWATRTHGAHARLVLRKHGNLALVSGTRQLWVSNTAGSGATKLVMANDGSLSLRSSGGRVWSYRLGSKCGTAAGKRVVVDLSAQSALLCNGHQQQLVTPITSGASAYGNGTPTGTWYLQAKQRERYLYPAAGGAYYVHYWLPYDGAYGMHDSSWQNFPYGSARYRTEGSHGCVHFPRAAIAWMYVWAPIGTMVRIQG